MSIAHKVESGRAVILDGVLYKPDSDTLVYLPRLFATDEIVPEQPGAPGRAVRGGRGQQAGPDSVPGQSSGRCNEVAAAGR